MFHFVANVDVDATGPGRSLGTDADGAPRTCGDLPALPGCIPRLVLPGDAAADRPRADERKLPKPAGVSSRKCWNGRKISAPSRPEAVVRCRNIRQGSCSPTATPARQIHLANQGHAPTGSNRTLSGMTDTQAGNKSGTLADQTHTDRDGADAGKLLTKSTR